MSKIFNKESGEYEPAYLLTTVSHLVYCTECGAVVWDRDKHSSYHSQKGM